MDDRREHSGKTKSWIYLATLCLAFQLLGDHFSLLGSHISTLGEETVSKIGNDTTNRVVFPDFVYVQEQSSTGVPEGDLIVLAEVVFGGHLFSRAAENTGTCPFNASASETPDAGLKWSFDAANMIQPSFAFESLVSQ